MASWPLELHRFGWRCSRFMECFKFVCILWLIPAKSGNLVLTPTSPGFYMRNAIVVRSVSESLLCPCSMYEIARTKYQLIITHHPVTED